MAMSLAEPTETIPPIKVLKIQELKMLDLGLTDVIAAGPDGTIVAGGRFKDHMSIYRRKENGKYTKDKEELKLPPLNSLNAPFVLDIAMTRDGNYIVARNGYVEMYHNREVTIFYISTGNFLFSFGPHFRLVEEHPTCVTVLPNGCIVVGDTVKKAVIVHSPQGKKKENNNHRRRS